MLEGRQFDLRRICSRCEIYGKERAVVLANDGTLDQVAVVASLRSTNPRFKLAIKKVCLNIIKQLQERKNWKFLSSRGPIPAILLGHKCSQFLRSNRSRLSPPAPQSHCHLCDHETMDHTKTHLSEEYKKERLYWSERRLMAQHPRAFVG